MPFSKQFLRLTIATVGVIGLVTGCTQLDVSRLNLTQLDGSQSEWLTRLRQFGEWSTLWLCSTVAVWLVFRLPQVDVGSGSEFGSHHRDRTFGQVEQWQTRPIPGDAEKANALATFWAIAYFLGAAYIPWASTVSSIPIVVKNLLIPGAFAALLAWLLWEIANSSAIACKVLKRLWQLVMILTALNWLVWLLV